MSRPHPRLVLFSVLLILSTALPSFAHQSQQYTDDPGGWTGQQSYEYKYDSTTYEHRTGDGFESTTTGSDTRSERHLFKVVGPAPSGAKREYLVDWQIDVHSEDTRSTTETEQTYDCPTPGNPLETITGSHTSRVTSSGSAKGRAVFYMTTEYWQLSNSGRWFRSFSWIRRSGDEPVAPVTTTYFTSSTDGCDGKTTTNSRQEQSEAEEGMWTTSAEELAKDTFSGSQTKQDQGAYAGGTTWTETTTRSFNYARGDGLQLGSFELLKREFPSGSWAPLGSGPAIDGSPIKLVATVNNSGTTRAATVTFRGEDGNPLPNGVSSVQFAQGDTRVEYELNTTGLAWKDDGSPRTNLTLSASLTAPNREYGTLTQSPPLAPRPVIMVHGLNSNALTWESYPAMLAAAHPNWRGYAVTGLRTGNDAVNQEQSNTLLQNAAVLREYVQQTRDFLDAWHVDLLGHSMGGLISRQYLNALNPGQAGGTPVVAHLVMLGTPNRGSPCAYAAVGMNDALGVPNINAPVELIPEVVALFNLRVNWYGGTRLSILAGDPLPVTCQANQAGDGVVAVESAFHIFGDRGYTTSHHIAMPPSQSDFNAWVLPHLRGKPGAAGTATSSAASSAAQVKATATSGSPQFVGFGQASIAPGATVDLPVAAPQAAKLTLVVTAPAAVELSLVNPAGSVVQADAANVASARQPFRSLSASGVAGGSWLLRARNTGAAAAPVRLAASVEGAALELGLAVGEPDAEGRVAITATLKRDGGAATGGTVTAKLSGPAGATSLSLLDDGRHGDGAANDGVYGVTTGALGLGSYAFTVTAEQGGQRIYGVSGTVRAPATLQRLYLPLARK